MAHADMETDYSTPKDYFAHAGRLAKLLLAGHPDKDGKPLVQLDRESFQRIVDWLDVNAVCYGDYSWNKLEWREPLPEGERALREHIRGRFGPHLAEQPFAALVNVACRRKAASSKHRWRQRPAVGACSRKGWRTARTRLPPHARTRGSRDRPATASRYRRHLRPRRPLPV